MYLFNFGVIFHSSPNEFREKLLPATIISRVDIIKTDESREETQLHRSLRGTSRRAKRQGGEEGTSSTISVRSRGHENTRQPLHLSHPLSPPLSSEVRIDAS